MLCYYLAIVEFDSRIRVLSTVNHHHKMGPLGFDAELCSTCSAIHVNYEQSLVNMINTVPLKDYVGQLVTSILQLYMGNVGLEDGEQRNRNESKAFTPHSPIMKLHSVECLYRVPCFIYFV